MDFPVLVLLPFGDTCTCMPRCLIHTIINFHWNWVFLTQKRLGSLAWVQMPLSFQKLNQGWGAAVKTLGMKSILTTTSFVNCTYSLCQNPNSQMSSHQVAAVLYQQKYYHYYHWFESIKAQCILLYFVFQVGCSKSLSCQKMAKQRSYVFQPEEK